MIDLTGKTILITGASSGIGRATAELAAELGAQVILVARSAERLGAVRSTLHGRGHTACPFDLTDVDAVPLWLRKTVVTESGPLHAIVHAAGIAPNWPVRALKQGMMEDLFRLNLHAATALAKGFRHKAVQAGGGSLVFVASVAGMRGRPALTTYGASKAGLISLAQSLAIELASDGIRANCVSPGWVQTPMTQAAENTITATALEETRARHPLGLGTPRDVANAILFLVSDAARWITGTNLVVDGGYTAQ